MITYRVTLIEPDFKNLGAKMVALLDTEAASPEMAVIQTLVSCARMEIDTGNVTAAGVEQVVPVTAELRSIAHREYTSVRKAAH